MGAILMALEIMPQYRGVADREQLPTGKFLSRNRQKFGRALKMLEKILHANFGRPRKNSKKYNLVNSFFREMQEFSPNPKVFPTPKFKNWQNPKLQVAKESKKKQHSKNQHKAPNKTLGLEGIEFSLNLPGRMLDGPLKCQEKVPR